MHMKLYNGLTISILTESETGGHVYAGEGTAEIALWPTHPTDDSPKWFVPVEFEKYSSDGQICAYVPLLQVLKYIARNL